ncbi:hypothetical protein EPUL_006851, partial [Erysiphe pulchra]
VFALIAKDKTGRKLLLSLSDHLPKDIFLVAARNLFNFLLPKIPTNVIRIEGKIPVAGGEVIAELEQVTGLTPKSIRYMGKSKFGAPNRTWMVFYDKDSALNPGFRLFEDSGQTKLNHKRCLGFYSTGCCSRAPAFGKNGLIMHSEEECKALT